jgi:hypothetical protein
MAISSTFYLDSPSLSTATAIYSDIYLTTLAADGFYSEGSIVREQSLGVLLPQVVCPSCGSSDATFDGDFILCVQAGSTKSFRAQDGSFTAGHFTTTATIVQPNCSGYVPVSGTLTSTQGPLIILVPSVPVGNTAVIVAQSIAATNAVTTTAVVGGILRIIITPNSYPITCTLSGTLTVTYP